MAALIDLSPVSFFVAVAELSSFSAAGRKLGVPTSTVSRAVAALEGELRVQLFQRTTRHVSLTTDGAALFEKVAPAFRTIASALGSAPETEEPAGLLRVTAPPDLGAMFLSEAVTQFTARYPSVTVEVWLGSQRADLVKEGFDAAIRGTGLKLTDSSLIARKLRTIEFQIYASPAYLAQRGRPHKPADAAHHDWVEFRGWRYPRELAAVDRKARLICNDFLFAREALRSGAGLGLLPTFLARADVAGGSLVGVLPKVQQPGGQIILVYNRANQIPKRLHAFRDFLADTFFGTF
jgi:DNA-binding transcriptional LysR family regulator